MTYTTRFAPSPTGPLHLGHAYSALTAYDRARALGGRFLLRIEDIDRQRSKPEWEAQIYDDLSWLGISWDTPVMRQSDRIAAYWDVLQELWDRELIYPCHCNRKDILAASAAPQEGDGYLYGPDGLLYPGTCRNTIDRSNQMPKHVALRLDIGRAMAQIGETPITFVDNNMGKTASFSAHDIITGVGDIVLSRKDFVGSYHLVVVLDDAAQNITEVIRGEDLYDTTQIHVVLQRLLGLPTPTYHHHPLIRDKNGKRLAKRDDARAIAKYREDGCTPGDIRQMVGL